MIIYNPTEIKVELTERETKTIQSCREVIKDIIDSLNRRDCDSLVTEGMLLSKENLLDMSRRLELLLEVEAMY